MLITNGVVYTMDGPVYAPGFVAVENGKISAVGHMGRQPAGTIGETVDAGGGSVLPGFVDAHCHLGILEDSIGPRGGGANEAAGSIGPQVRAIDGVNPYDRCFQEAREGGVTTVLTGPGSASPIGGQFAALKTMGRRVDDMVISAAAHMKFALGENPRRQQEGGSGPMTRMATAALIRETLSRAREYGRRREAGKAEGYQAALEALLPVLRREMPAHFHAHRADDMFTAIRIAREFDLECVIVHGTDGHLIADVLAAEGIPVILGPILTDRSKPEQKSQTLDNLASLLNAGVSVAICSDHPETPIQYLPLCAAVAAKRGVTPEAALAAITIEAAKIAKIDHRVGSLTPGKDADIIVCTGHPLDIKTQISAVWIDGKPVEERK